MVIFNLAELYRRLESILIEYTLYITIVLLDFEALYNNGLSKRIKVATLYD